MRKSVRASATGPALRRNLMTNLIRCAFMLCLTANGRAALAHHSFAMYDSQQLLTVTGTVKAFQWSNPHVVLWLIDGPNKDGTSELWTLELPTSPGVLTRLGWNEHSLQAGDRVIVEFNPLRNREHGGSFKKATLVDTGKVLVLNIGAPPPAARPDSQQP
jgi:hypothetical protein